MKLYSAKEAMRIINRFTHEIRASDPSSQDCLDGITIFMRAVSEMEEWLDRIDENKFKNGFKLFGWQDYE